MATTNSRNVFLAGEEVVDWLAEHGAEAVVILEVDARQKVYFVESALFGCHWVPFNNFDPTHDRGQDIA